MADKSEVLFIGHAVRVGQHGAPRTTWGNSDDSRTLPVADTSSALRSGAFSTKLRDSTAGHIKHLDMYGLRSHVRWVVPAPRGVPRQHDGISRTQQARFFIT